MKLTMKNISIWIKFDEEFPSLEDLRIKNFKNKYCNLIEFLENNRGKCGLDLTRYLSLHNSIASTCMDHDLLEMRCFSSSSIECKEFIEYISGQGFICRLVQRRYVDEDHLDLSFEFEKHDLIVDPVEYRLSEISEKLELINKKLIRIERSNNF